MKIAIDFSGWLLIDLDHIPNYGEAQEYVMKTISNQYEEILIGELHTDNIEPLK